jgi:hypothetical protein
MFSWGPGKLNKLVAQNLAAHRCCYLGHHPHLPSRIAEVFHRKPHAVSALLPHIVPINAFYVINRLNSTAHPTEHGATLDLIDASVDPSQINFGRNTLRSILDRLREAKPDLSDNIFFRRWNERVQVLN